jgi:hypothetical protein
LDTLNAALAVRDAFGRVSDVIHAAVIPLALPRILEPDEPLTVRRPSLLATTRVASSISRPTVGSPSSKSRVGQAPTLCASAAPSWIWSMSP